MRKMVYKNITGVEVLHSGTYVDREFLILNLGSHPTAYVKLKKEEILNEGETWDFYSEKIKVHGGITFLDENKYGGEGTWLGWDYAHGGDFVFGGLFLQARKWTTEEIFEDVKSVIEQLKELNK